MCKISDDMMGVHLRVKEEIEKKKNEIILSGEEYTPLTEEMIISSCMQVSFTFILDGRSVRLKIKLYLIILRGSLRDHRIDECKVGYFLSSS